MKQRKMREQDTLYVFTELFKRRELSQYSNSKDQEWGNSCKKLKTPKHDNV